MPKKNPLNFDIFRLAGPSRTSVWAILHGGEIAGRIITAWPGDGMGLTKCAIHLWRGPLGNLPALQGQAGGYGSCKESAAVDDAMDRAGVDHPDMHGAGMSTVAEWFESKGYTIRQLL